MRTLIALACFAPLAAAQTTWYVDVHATPPGVGSVAQPYTSIQYAINQSTTVAGDTLLVAPGVYSGALNIGKAIEVRSSDGPLATVLTAPGAIVRAFGPGGGAQLDGFTLRLGNDTPTSVAIGMWGDGATARNCIVIGPGSGVGFIAALDLYVDHCLVTGCDRGIAEQGHPVGSVRVRNSISWNNVEDLHLFTDVADVAYSCFLTADQLVGPGNVNSPPQWFDELGHDFHLLASSPCIDSGDPSAPLDPDGSRADMGPLPFDANWAPFTTYCTAKTNSLGCAPTIGASGTASSTSNLPFVVTCTSELNNKLGLLFYGFGPKNTAYQGGWLCVQSPVRRTQLMNSGGNTGLDDCSGVYSFDFNALVRSGSDPMLEPGRDVFIQFWSRDPAASFTTNRSDALRAQVQP